jgi:hypothetical protein
VNYTKGDFSAKFPKASEFVFALFLTNTDFSTLWRKKRILAKNTPIYGGITATPNEAP